MMKTILASAATIVLTMGTAIAQDLPPATGLTPGAPLASDPVSDEGVVAGETGIAEQAFVAPEPALPPAEPMAAAPMAEPVPAEPILAEPMGIAQPPIAPDAPVALGYPDIPSSAGLTPGAPLGSDAVSDRKVVAGAEGRAIGGDVLFR